MVQRPGRGGRSHRSAEICDGARLHGRGYRQLTRGAPGMLDKTSPAKNPLAMAPADRMPREIASGVFWIGDCLLQRHKGKVYHGYNAAFLVAGDDASILVETGHPKDFPVVERHLNVLLARGVPPIKYLFVTHQETPHRSEERRVGKECRSRWS